MFFLTLGLLLLLTYSFWLVCFQHWCRNSGYVYIQSTLSLNSIATHQSFWDKSLAMCPRLVLNLLRWFGLASNSRRHVLQSPQCYDYKCVLPHHTLYDVLWWYLLLKLEKNVIYKSPLAVILRLACLKFPVVFLVLFLYSFLPSLSSLQSNVFLS